MFVIAIVVKLIILVPILTFAAIFVQILQLLLSIEIAMSLAHHHSSSCTLDS
jgi:hypothetical protein